MVCQRIIADGVGKGPDPLATEAVVTGCPWCEESLKSAAKAEASDMNIMDVMEMVIKSAENNI